MGCDTKANYFFHSFLLCDALILSFSGDPREHELQSNSAHFWASEMVGVMQPERAAS